MNVNYFNVLISSRNKKALDTNTVFSVSIDDEFFNAANINDEYYVCMSQFQSIKSFYSCQDGLNNHFQVIFRLPGMPENIETFDIYLSEGNYDVISLKKEIQKQTNNALFDISYDAKTNKYLYKNLFQPTFQVFIKPITSGVFLGFEDNVEYLITADGTYSSKFINLSGYTNLVIKLQGDLNIRNTISNMQDEAFKYDKVLGVLNINDVAPMDSISFENDGCLFKHRFDGKVNDFKIRIVNEDGLPFPNMADWMLSLKFEKVVKVNQYIMMERLLARINFFLGSMFLYFNIPVPIGLDDFRR
jgi:hypothetical protein